MVVAMLALAAFAGVAFVDDADAAEAATDSYKGAVDFGASDVFGDITLTNEVLGNTGLKYEAGKIVGMLNKFSESEDKTVTLADVQALWGDKAKTMNHFIVYSIDAPSAYVTFKDSNGDFKSLAVKDGKCVFTSYMNSDRADDVFEFYFTEKAVAPGEEKTFNVEIYKKNTIQFAVELGDSQVRVEYTVGANMITRMTADNAMYTLATLEDLGQPVPEGKKFVGWKDAKGNVFPAGTVIAMAGAINYTAVFEALPDVTVIFVDGDKSMAINSSELPAKVPTWSKEGNTFVGWMDVEGNIIDPKTAIFEKDITLFAKWQPINCYVTFMAGDEIVKETPVLYGDKVVMPALPEGYTAWDFDFSKAITEDMTIKAIEAPAPEPSGLDNPVVLTAAIFAVVVIVILGFALMDAMKKGKIVIGKGPNAKKKDENDENGGSQ